MFVLSLVCTDDADGLLSVLLSQVLLPAYYLTSLKDVSGSLPAFSYGIMLIFSPLFLSVNRFYDKTNKLAQLDGSKSLITNLVFDKRPYQAEAVMNSGLKCLIIQRLIVTIAT